MSVCVKAVGEHVTIGWDNFKECTIIELPLDKLGDLIYALPDDSQPITLAKSGLIAGLDFIGTSTYTEGAKECKAVAHRLRSLIGAEEAAKKQDAANEADGDD